MDGRTQGALMLAVGGVTVRLALSDAALNFIRPEYVPLQLIAGAVLLVLGAITLVRGLRVQVATASDDHDLAEDNHPTHDHPADDDHDRPAEEVALLSAHGHDHDRGPRVAWMLAAPLFAILLVAPPPLGSFAANRQSGVIQSSAASYAPLPPAQDGAVPLGLADYTVRALYDTEQSLEGQRVRLTGFVSRTEADGEEGWLLTRFAMNCCAADGTAINVEVVGDQPSPPIDEWVVVEGTWANREGHEIGELTGDPPLLQVESVTTTDQPLEPYEI